MKIYENILIKSFFQILSRKLFFFALILIVWQFSLNLTLHFTFSREYPQKSQTCLPRFCVFFKALRWFFVICVNETKNATDYVWFWKCTVFKTILNVICGWLNFSKVILNLSKRLFSKDRWEPFFCRNTVRNQFSFTLIFHLILNLVWLKA